MQDLPLSGYPKVYYVSVSWYNQNSENTVQTPLPKIQSVQFKDLFTFAIVSLALWMNTEAAAGAL